MAKNPRNIIEWISLNSKPKLGTFSSLDLATYLFFGLTGPIWTFPITYRFGEKVAGWLSSQDQAKWGYSFVIISGLSSSALFARLGNLIFKNFMTYRQHNNEENIFKKNKTTTRLVATALLILVAATTSTPSTYETYKDYKRISSTSLTTLITIFTLLNLTVKNVWAFNNLILHAKNFALTHSPDRILSLRNRKIKSILNTLTIYGSKLPFLTEQELSNDSFFDRFSCISPLVLQTNRKLLNYEISFSLFGSLIGIIGSYYSFPLGKAGSADFFTKTLKANENTTKAFSNVLGTLAFIFHASLLTYTGYDCFGKFYKAISCNNPSRISQTKCLSSVLGFIIGSIAIIGGAPVAEMTYENINAKSFYGPIVIISALLAMAGSKYWAMKGILKNHSKSPCRIATEKTLDKLIRLSPNLQDQELDTLNNKLNSRSCNA